MIFRIVFQLKFIFLFIIELKINAKKMINKIIFKLGLYNIDKKCHKTLRNVYLVIRVRILYFFFSVRLDPFGVEINFRLEAVSSKLFGDFIHTFDLLGFGTNVPVNEFISKMFPHHLTRVEGIQSLRKRAREDSVFVQGVSIRRKFQFVFDTIHSSGYHGS